MLSLIRTASRCRSDGLLHHNLSKLRIIPCLKLCVNAKSVTAREILIPVPYGSLAAKAWGKENGYPVMALHGYKDNCGTFDRLIPLLDDSLYVVALDFPGHGLSSHLPPGTQYVKKSFLTALQYAVNHLQWKQFSLIGHSMGGIISQAYASFYPEVIQKVIMLDAIAPPLFRPDKLPTFIASAINSTIEVEDKFSGPPPVYTTEIAKKRLIEGLFGEATGESADILLRRGTKPAACGTGVVFTSDPKNYNPINTSLYEAGIEFALISRLKCEMLIITAKNTHRFYDPKKHQRHIIDSFVQQLKNYCKTFVMETVDGTHFVHINNPERLTTLINEFLLSNR